MRGAKRKLPLSRSLLWQLGINKPFLFIAWLIPATLVTASPVNAHFYTGNDLKEWAVAHDRIESGNASRKDYNYAFTLQGYVAGTHDSWEGEAICNPAGVTLGQIIGILKNYLRNNPGKWNLPAGDLIVMSASVVFPCN